MPKKSFSTQRRFFFSLSAAVLLLGAPASPMLLAQVADPAPSPTAASSSPSLPAADVPVRQVILFSSGVGYFQHEGTVRGDAETELRFKTAQVNDILKSLVLQDLDGGRVGAVTYPSQDPLEKTLRSFQINIGDNPSLGDLLNQLRGARVSVSVGAENFSGTILGVEQKTVAKDKDDHPIERPFLNLITDLGIRSVPLDDVRKWTLDDAALREELNKALAALAAARDQDKKPVDIRFNGQGERRVRVGYVVETPIWKASYRLIFSGEADAKPGATLQGWAIVENQTDNDWRDVKLSLVSGRPISFIQDLYQPLYVPRPEVKPELYSSLRPQQYEGGQSNGPAGAAASDSDEERSKTTAGAGPRRGMRAASTPAAPPPPEQQPAPMTAQFRSEQRRDSIEADKSIQSVATTAQIGELFQYTVGNVTLPRQRSAMIPILNDPIEAEKVSIFNERTLSKYALNGARLKNSTGKALMQGPVTVLEEGGYAGDASLGDVPAGQSRLLSFGVDLQLLVTPQDLASASRSELQTGKIVGGVLELANKRHVEREYSAENKSDHARKLVVEHARRGDEWKLVETPAPVETTAQLYRFELPVPAGKKEKLVVKEEIIDRTRLAILSTDPGTILYYSQQGQIPPPVRDALAKAATMQQAAVATERAMNDKRTQVETITQEQNRIRENLKTVDRQSAYATRLLKKLDDQESQIEKLRAEADALREKLDGQRRELGEYLKGINIG
ncbi:MAG: DUF4139 domain-containing protein [Verrucomicrobia bacterium]|nr:DUF4139 domain-containing protein [Verrucomicrobiota bacterium]